MEICNNFGTVLLLAKFSGTLFPRFARWPLNSTVKEHIYIKIQPLIKSWESDTYVYYQPLKACIEGALTTFVIGDAS